MNSESVIGQTLDGKYRIEKQLGKGGMGTVYLATHIGTERPVAVKVIQSEFMKRAEFVERFRREARAAGRLRHPNVVDVTDFGFSQTKTGNAAYLVMEYLDGCTLGEILEEEERLPLSWSIDILEQVSSAVQEAHEQGIIHRDLKPDNIWLEPNQRGGYTVKVLDFGIAKLEETEILSQAGKFAELPQPKPSNKNLVGGRATIALDEQAETIHTGEEQGTVAENRNSTMISEAATMALSGDAEKPSSEAGTIIQPIKDESENRTVIQSVKNDSENKTVIQQAGEVDLEDGTAIFPSSDKTGSEENEKNATKLISAPFETDESVSNTSSTTELTRVGAVLGTPLYMSPEQCAGGKLSPRSDIYSLGVIAYQMLSGATPFSGDYTKVMKAHKVEEPPPLTVKKVPKKVKNLIHSALAKDIYDRPPTAKAFASELRAQSEGIGVLLRRALEIYSRYLPKFLGLTLLLYIPFIVITLLGVAADILYISGKISHTASQISGGLVFFGIFFTSLFCGYLLWGTVTWIIAQILAVPLRPVKVRPALRATLEKWKSLVWVGFISGTLSLIGYACCFVLPGIYLSVIWALAAPVVMMESLRGREALDRSKLLVKRSLRTTLAAIAIIFLLPALLGGMVGAFSSATVEAGTIIYQERIKKQAEKENSAKTENASTDPKKADSKEKSETRYIKDAFQSLLTKLLPLPFQLILLSFASILIALLYFKTRQIGGEPTNDLFEQFEDFGDAKSNWQKRVRKRLVKSGRATSSNHLTS